MVAGVCGGIAEYFGVDATLIRVAYVILGVMSTGFPALLVYLILAFVMPER
jgi:phage shock protein C